MRHTLIGLLLFGGPPLFATIGNLYFDNQFGGNWRYVGGVIGFFAPILAITFYGRSTHSRLKNEFDAYKTHNGLKYDILELCDRCGFAVDIQKQVFVFLPVKGEFRQVSFDDFQSVKLQKQKVGHEMIFQVKDLESPLVRIDFTGGKPETAMARLRAAEIIS